MSKACRIATLAMENINEKAKLLKMEVYAMRLANQRKSKHFTICKDTGALTNFLYVAMTIEKHRLSNNLASAAH
jgi:hypothetical protein